MIQGPKSDYLSQNERNSSEKFELLDAFLQAFFPDANELVRLRLLAPKGAPVSIRMSAHKRSNLLSNSELQGELMEANRELGVYFVVNSGGDMDAEIVRFNAFFCERDDIPIRDQHLALDNYPLPPSVRVETAKSVHAYWLLAEDCDPDQWRAIQRQLINHFQSDPKIANPSRLMRLPYFDHLTFNPDDHSYSPTAVMVHTFDDSRRYTVEQMIAGFGDASSHSNSESGSVNQFETWDELNAEARRRIRKLHPVKVSNDGLWLHTKGICHNGVGNTALYLNLDTGAYGCQAECPTNKILRALGLPETPQPRQVNDSDLQLISSWGDFAQQRFEDREKIIFELEPGEVGLLLASTNVGKTTLAMNLSLHVAAGGKFEPLLNDRKQSGRGILYIDGESRKGRFQWNIERMLRDWDSDEQALVKQNLHIMCDSFIQGSPLDLSNESHLNTVISEAQKREPALIVVDTLSSLFSLQNENDNAEVQKRVMRPLGRLASTTGSAILLVHHIGKQSEDAQSGSKAYRGRGASVIGASARLVLLLKPDPHDEDRVSLVCAKAKGRKFADVLMRLDPVSRWFAYTGKPPVSEPSSYQRVVDLVSASGVIKRAEIEKGLNGVIKSSQIGKHLKAALDSGDLRGRHGRYAAPENAHMLDAIDNEQMSISKEDAQDFHDVNGANAHSLVA